MLNPVKAGAKLNFPCLKYCTYFLLFTNRMNVPKRVEKYTSYNFLCILSVIGKLIQNNIYFSFSVISSGEVVGLHVKNT